MNAEPEDIQNANPFSAPVKAAAIASNAVSEAASAREVAEIQGAMVIAKRFPRDARDAMDRILMACARPTLAESALYSYARGGQEITGPSIRLAEAIAQAWGNLSFGIRELDQRQGESTVEAFAIDLETNTRQVKVFQVPHVRHTKSGVRKLEDPRDIYELTANQGARRLRACILGIVPGDVIEAAVRQCDVTLKAKAEVTPERLKSLVEKFAEYGVTREHIEKRIQRHLDAITPALLLQLGKIFNSLKDGMSSAGDWFELASVPQPAASAAQRAKDILRGGSAKSKPESPSLEPTGGEGDAA